ncbi:NAD(+) diphosphatase [Actibacterium ureilyticum]|uniref:NAD(+) diphosphatase n=1 Tax=Actibacterium ureilyticum TaxID=1590614 RepID=UPI000BAAABCB|nr:NAD(+) diphosphatase [Actibacterium ureilyticum]
MKLAETVTFGGAGLERAAHLRSDSDALARMWGDPSARVLLLWRGKPLLRAPDLDRLDWLPASHTLIHHRQAAAIFLGLVDGAPRFACDLSDWVPEAPPEQPDSFLDASEQVHPDLAPGGVFAELRRVMARLSPADAELAATAKAVIGWHQTHGFCARCGAATQPVMAGWQRGCPQCQGQHFPRTDPVVIMLITHGNSVLLGRSPGWPEGMYSLLAGFVEPGETLEAAVRREVHEEAGIRVGQVGYLASQPWPFPASLMFGAWGVALGREITLDPVELEDALWVSREEMLSIFAGEHTRIKPARQGAIAQFLMQHWLADRLD